MAGRLTVTAGVVDVILTGLDATNSIAAYADAGLTTRVYLPVTIPAGGSRAFYAADRASATPTVTTLSGVAISAVTAPLSAGSPIKLGPFVAESAAGIPSTLSVVKTTATAAGVGTDILFDQVITQSGTWITYNPATGVATVQPGTYQITAALRMATNQAVIDFDVVDTSNVAIAPLHGSSNAASTQSDLHYQVVKTFATVSSFKVRVTAGTGSLGGNQQYMNVVNLDI